MAKVTIIFEDVDEENPLSIRGDFEPEFRGDQGQEPTPAQDLAIQVLTLLEAYARRLGGTEVLNEGTEFEERRDYSDGGQVARWG